jgi:hypothetical protein
VGNTVISNDTHPGSAFSIDVSRGRRNRFVAVTLPLNNGAVVPWEGASDCFALSMGGCSLLDLDRLGGSRLSSCFCESPVLYGEYWELEKVGE